MSSVYSTLFFSGHVTAGTPVTVPLSTLTGTIVIRTLRVICDTTFAGMGFAVDVNGGPHYAFAEALAGPFTDTDTSPTVWPDGFDMLLNCTGADMDFWISGYLLTP
jgi:hypothetical protein